MIQKLPQRSEPDIGTLREVKKITRYHSNKSAYTVGSKSGLKRSAKRECYSNGFATVDSCHTTRTQCLKECVLSLDSTTISNSFGLHATIRRGKFDKERVTADSEENIVERPFARRLGRYFEVQSLGCVRFSRWVSSSGDRLSILTLHASCTTRASNG